MKNQPPHPENVRFETKLDSEIIFWLNSYDDLFSDFDPRAYSIRGISDDFLIEARKAIRDKEVEKIQVHFLIPILKRHKHDDNIIKKRLQDHFKKHYQLLLKEHQKNRRKGISLTLAGALLMVGAALMAAYNHDKMLFNVLLVLMEPGGWFLTWSGLETLVFPHEEKAEELEFYRKMHKSEISFNCY